MSKNIAVLVGSLGNNIELANKIDGHLKELGATVTIINLPKLDLPLYDTDKEKNGIPEKAIELANILIASQGLVLIAPEYNGTMPPVVNNAIAWVSRSSEKDWRAAFNEKMAVVATHSGGGGAKVCEAMKKQLEHLGCNVLARPILTNYSKELNPDSAKTIFGQLLNYI